jgi:hypothetical protein
MEPSTLDRRIHTGTLACFVLTGIHSQNDLVAGRHGCEGAMTAKRNADTVGAPHRRLSQSNHETECAVDNLIV